MTRPGYDWLSQPVSALSLGPGGTVQVVNFIAFGTLGCITALAWRLTLTGGIGETWYPRLADRLRHRTHHPPDRPPRCANHTYTGLDGTSAPAIS